MLHVSRHAVDMVLCCRLLDHRSLAISAAAERYSRLLLPDVSLPPSSLTGPNVVEGRLATLVAAAQQLRLEVLQDAATDLHPAHQRAANPGPDPALRRICSRKAMRKLAARFAADQGAPGILGCHEAGPVKMLLLDRLVRLTGSEGACLNCCCELILEMTIPARLPGMETQVRAVAITHPEFGCPAAKIVH